MEMPKQLPEGCIAHIVSLTSPLDACRSAMVSPLFRSAVDSDVVWEKFLPSDYLNIISNMHSASSPMVYSSKKDLYFRLCHNPILIGDGTMSFGLEKRSGKKCYMIGARGLAITCGHSPSSWKWKSLPESRFSEVAMLKLVWWLHIKGTIDTKNLSPKTTYAAYLVFKFPKFSYGFDQRPVIFCVRLERSEVGGGHTVLLDPPKNMLEARKGRGDGWMEIEMGEIFNECGEDGMVVCSAWEIDNYNPKQGLIIEGIEFRPKDGV